MRSVRYPPEEMLYPGVSRGSSQTCAAGWVFQTSHTRALRDPARQPKLQRDDSVAKHAWLEGGSVGKKALQDGDATPRRFGVVQQVDR